MRLNTTGCEISGVFFIKKFLFPITFQNLVIFIIKENNNMNNKTYSIVLIILIIIEGVLIMCQTNTINEMGKIISDKNHTIEVISSYGE